MEKESYKLFQGIVNLSNSKSWELARLEWGLDHTFWDDFGDSCLCGHQPIKEVCVLVNKINGNKTIVGNICVQKFFPDLPSELFFKSIRKILEDIKKAFNILVVEHAYNRGWIDEKSFDFYRDTWTKRKLSEKQFNWRVAINKIILGKLVRKRTYFNKPG